MKSINKSEYALIESINNELNGSLFNINQIIEEINATGDPASADRKELESEVYTANNSLGKLRTMFEFYSCECSDYYESQTEAWKESDTGISYKDWLNTIVNLAERLDVREIVVELEEQDLDGAVCNLVVEKFEEISIPNRQPEE